MLFRFETVVVEDLGRVIAEARVETPRRLEEDASLRWHGRDVTQHVSQGRLLRARWVRALEWLIELLRVAEENDAGSRSAHREHVRERDLARLVDEQDVDGPRHLGRGPQPRRPRGKVRPAIGEASAGLARVGRALHVLVVEHMLGVSALDRADSDTFLPRRAESGSEQVADDLVTRAGDADAVPGRDERADHPGAGVRLARAGRTLDRKDRLIELECEAASAVQVRLVRADQRGADALAGPRR